MIDLQVNGFAGVDFNSDGLTPANLRHACEALRASGVSAFLPTIITAPLDRMCARLEALVAAREEDEYCAGMVPGFHIEGPFINPAPGFVGAHPAHAVRPADMEAMQKLLIASKNLARIVTLAPEQDSGCIVTEFLASRGIVVAAGHCDPSSEQLDTAMRAGLSMFTHLGNGCPTLLHRHNNIIQRALHRGRELHISFIADGAHVPWETLLNYFELVPPERRIIVSDAIAAAGLGPGTYTLGEREVVVGEDLIPRDGDHFVGSATPLALMAERLEWQLGLSPDDITLMTTTNPGKLL